MYSNREDMSQRAGTEQAVTSPAERVRWAGMHLFYTIFECHVLRLQASGQSGLTFKAIQVDFFFSLCLYGTDVL